MKTRLIILASIAFSMLAPPAGAANGDCRLIRGANTPEDPADDVQVCRQDAWIHKGTQALGNLAGQGLSTVPSWDGTKPAGPIQSAGVYYPLRLLDILEPYNTSYRPTFEGKFTGTVDTLGAQIYVRLPAYEALGAPWPLLVRLSVDGETVFEQSDLEIDVPMVAEGNFARINFVFTKLYDSMQALGLDVSATKEHEVELALIQRYWGDGLPAGVFYDAAEVPSGLIFNLEPTSMAGYTKIDTTSTG